MLKWIIIIILVLVILYKIGDSPALPPEPLKPTKVYPPAPAPQQWSDTSQRKEAAQKAASSMGTKVLNNVGSEAMQIRRIVHERNININTGALNTAQSEILKICDHAERIRNEIQLYRNDPAHLQQLYRTGVGISNDAYKLRVQIKEMEDNLYKLSRTNSSLRPLYEQVRAFGNNVYANEVCLNERNRTLRSFIGTNFGTSERRWNEKIEERARAKRANA